MSVAPDQRQPDPAISLGRRGERDVRHLYVHLPFCAHRCGYCDFVTAVGRRGEHDAYADALLVELGRERWRLAPEVQTAFLGGGTPTFTEPRRARPRASTHCRTSRS